MPERLTLTFTLLITLLPIMLLSFLYYRNTMAAIKLELHTANSNYLNQTATAVERKSAGRQSAVCGEIGPYLL